jgi:hypothetical protein
VRLPGRWALALDEGFRLVFRRVDRGRGFALFAVGSLGVLGGTLALLLPEPFQLRAWVVAGCLDAVLIGVLAGAGRMLETGPFIVDASEKRFFLPGGSDLEFRALRAIRIQRAGPVAELSLLLDTFELRLGRRPVAEVERAAAAVARLTGVSVEEAA